MSAAPTSRASRLAVGIALVGITLGVVVLGVLHLVEPTASISAVRRTISEYQLTDLGWAFNAGVLAIAAGSAVLLVVLVRDRLTGPGGAVLMSGWIAGLLVLTAFPKHNWAIGPSATGQVHRMASLVAFLCLPIAVMLIAGRRGGGLPRGLARAATALAGLALVWFAPIIVAMAGHRAGGLPWWQTIPLGLVERGLALTQIGALSLLCVAVLRRRDAVLDSPEPADESAHADVDAVRP
jgi:hypothetical protein